MRVILGGLAVFVLVMFTGQVYAATSTVSMKAEATPQVLQFTGTGARTIAAAKYPVFTSVVGDNATCAAYLPRMYTGANDGTTALNTDTSGLSNAPIYLKSAIGNGASGSYRGTWEDVLSSGKINIDTQYQSSGRILVTWNVRIIGYSPNSAYTVWPTLCSAFHGTVNQRFTGGNAYTRLVVSKDNANWVALGNQISMTIPDAPGIKSVTNSSDPTHTGSYLITPTTFGTTTLPSKIYLKVQWKNDTALILGSADKMRSLVVTITRD